MSPRQFSEATNAIPPTSFEELDVTLARLASRKDAWPWVGISKRIEYLQMCADGIMTVADRWVQDGCKLKGIPSGHVLEGEEWVVGPAAGVRNLRLLVAALEAGGAPRIPKLRSRADGQLVARVFPANLYDRLVCPGFNADVWLEPGKPATQGEI